MKGDRLLTPLIAMQAILGARVVARMARGAGGSRIRAVTTAPVDSVAVIVPVLNEYDRLAPCLDGLIAQGPEVRAILVVDGGSHDRTQDLVAAYEARDARVRLVDASPVPCDWNGKAWGLQTGLERVDAAIPWVLTVDADVRPTPALARSLLAHAAQEGVAALSVAAMQELSDPLEGLLHPSMLTTLVYRFGPPGRVMRRVAAVQANGQCFLARRDILARSRAFAVARASPCEDITVARALVAAGYPVGFYEFYEGEDVVSVAMYNGWCDAWRNWPRSLPMRDQYTRLSSVLGLCEVTLAQALALPLFVTLLARRWLARRPSPLGGGELAALAVNGALAAIRLGVLAGTARAYRSVPLTYWLSPLCDTPVALQLWRSMFQRRHIWRGRILVQGGLL